MAFIIKKLPINDHKLALLIEKYIQKIDYRTANHIANFYGHWKEKEIVPKDIFGTPILYSFENISLYGVSKSDKYLKSLYNNYMQMPPLEKQITHANEIYIEESQNSL